MITSHKLFKNLIIKVTVGFFILRYQNITSKEMELHVPWAFTCVAIKKWWGLPSSIMESKQVEPLTGFLWWEQFWTWNLWAINFAPYSAFPSDSSSFITHLKTRRDNNFKTKKPSYFLQEQKADVSYAGMSNAQLFRLWTPESNSPSEDISKVSLAVNMINQ